ncbi:hypothetical protein A0H81_09285 [Grifola frondosa]|uniref:Uncharacterized protein n=1 Tax=Grifola frondosa TaxID=5627 RepID=A0A1C7M1B3_GRIFR|nr:hypothetical protein A0H81_09285 [Grifola frondosa]
MYSPTTKRSGDLPAMPPAYSPRSRMFDAGALEEKRRELFSTNRNSHFGESVTNQTNPSCFADEDYLLHSAYPPTCPSLSEKVEIMTVHSFESARSSMPSNGSSNPHTSAQNDNKQSCLWKFLSAPPLGYVLWSLLCILSLGLVVLAMALGLLLGQVVLHAARPLDSGYVSSITMSLRVGAVGGTVLCIPTALICCSACLRRKQPEEWWPWRHPSF